jgi:FecR protein
MCSVACAEIGNVVDLTGVAIVKRGKEIITTTRNMGIEINDVIETKNGIVNIRFKDNTTVKVTENSSLVIDDFVYDAKNSSGGKLGLKAAAGTVRYVSGNIAHNNPNSVKINTPTAAIAVRGTDFVMAVDETGKSLVMLMPSCEIEQTVNLKGLNCGSGKIEVASGENHVVLDQPYQATLVETATTSPSPPVIVNLSNTPIGNNLIIKPPSTSSGIGIAQAAKSAAEKTGDVKNDDKSNSLPSTSEAQTVQTQQENNQQQTIAEQEAEDKALSELTKLQVEGVKVKDAPYEDEHIKRMYKDDNPNLNPTGWAWMGLSPNGNNFAAISLTSDNKVLVVVTQDRIIDAYNFAGSLSKPQGSITITQTYK